MKKIIEQVTNMFIRYESLLLTLIPTIISFVAVRYYYINNSILAYGDAESHLNISKRVISSITPGLGQLGGNWLPLQHLLMLPFLINDSMWRTGLGGSIISMLSYILSSIFVYKIVNLAAKDRVSGWLGTAVFMLNPNILYMQSTPMSELPLIVTILGSIYFLSKWSINGGPYYIVLSSIFAFLGSLIRYDAWFLIMFELLAILIINIQKKNKFSKIEGSLILFSVVACMGMFMWLFWNILIFKTPFYFLNGSYSAKAQQLDFLNKGELLSYNDIIYSTKLYSVVAFKNIGILIGSTALFSFIALIINNIINRKKQIMLVSIILLLVPFLFYVVTLYFGISIILTPELLPSDFQFKLFNVRYGIMMVASCSVVIGVFYSTLNRVSKILYLPFLLIIMFLFLTSKTIPVVLQDAKYGLSARKSMSPKLSLAGQYVPLILNEQEIINKKFSEIYDFGNVIFDDYSRPANPIDLNVKMKNLIYIGNHPFWEESLLNPSKFIRWIIVRRNESDSVWKAIKVSEDFNKNYNLIFTQGESAIYKIND